MKTVEMALMKKDVVRKCIIHMYVYELNMLMC